MGGQRKSRVIIAAAAGVLIAIYVLYDYRQAYNDLQLRARDLSVARAEFQALSKRFDMLSNELKGSVQASADLGRQLQEERKGHEQTKKEKEEIERHCQTEAGRFEGEKAQLNREKLQLIEDKDQMKRERDRFSSQLETMTQECTDARTDCQAKHQQCVSESSSLRTDLEACRNALNTANSDSRRYSQELYDERARNQRCESEQRRLEQQLRDTQQQQQQQVPAYRKHSSDNNGWGQQQQHQQGPPQPRDRQGYEQQHQQLPQLQQERDRQGYQQQHQQPSQLQQQERGRQQSYDRREWYQEGDDHYHGAIQARKRSAPPAPADDGQFHPAGREDGHPAPVVREENQHHAAEQEEGRPQHAQVEGEHHAAGQEEGHPQHIGEEDKRAIYERLSLMVARGETLTEKQDHVYRLLSRQFGAAPGGRENPGKVRIDHDPLDSLGAGGGGGINNNPPSHQNPEPNALPSPRPSLHPSNPSDKGGGDPSRHHQSPVIQQPPAPHGGGLPANNEQEEVKDLVDPVGGGQPKPVGGGVFDNIDNNKDRRAVGGARGPNADLDEGVELEEGDGRNDRPIDRDLRDGVDGVREHNDPLPNPLHEGAHQPQEGAHPPLDEPAAGGHPRVHEDNDFEGKRDNDDNEDDYGGGLVEREEEGRVKARRVDNINEDQDEGRRAFLEDQHMYEDERRRLLKREAVLQAPAGQDQHPSKEEGGGGMADQFRDAKRRREIR